MNVNDSDVANRFTNLGLISVEKGNYGRAFAHFLVALNLNSDLKSFLKDYFLRCLCEWSLHLEKEQRFDDLFECYRQAQEIYPENEVLLNNLGAHLLRINHYKEAASYFRKSLEANDKYLPAYRNLQNVSNLLVERWHYRMLNDNYRNNSFCDAIEQKIQDGFKVILDIGTGTGLLSLFSVDKGADKVFACDYSEIMASIAEDIITKNGFAKKIKIIRKLSNDLVIPDDIPERVSMVVTETMDVGLLGEHILKTITDAWDRLLLPQTSLKEKRVIPGNAVVYIVPVECFDVACKSKIISPSRIDKVSYRMPNNVKINTNEYYDSENMSLLKYKCLTEKPFPLLKIDFNNPDELKNLFDGNVDLNVTFDIFESGYIDSYVLWFEAGLSESVSISNSLSQDSCWEQAVFTTSCDMFVEKGSTINLKMKISEGILKLDDSDTKSSVDGFTISIGTDMAKFLNSYETLKCLDNVSNIVIPPSNSSPLQILDCFPFPHLGFKLIKKMSAQVISSPRPEVESDFITHYGKINALEENYLLVSRTELVELLKSGTVHIDFAAIDLFDSRGDLDENIILLIPILRSLIRTENWLTSVFPARVTVYFQLFNSEWLSKSCYFNNPELKKYKGFNVLNDYQVQQVLDLSFTTVPKVALSDEHKATTLSLDQLASNSPIEIKTPVEIIQNGKLNFLFYWFLLESSHGLSVCTKYEHFYVGQCAEHLKEELQVKKTDQLVINMIYFQSNFKFTLFTS